MAVGDTDMDDAAFPVELEQLRDQLRKIALGPTLEGEHTEPDALLYHYTDEQGIRGILESGTLWATALPCFEDKQETQYPIDFCYEYLADRQEQEADVRDLFLTALTKKMRSSEGIAHCLRKQAAACLSKRANLSSQWKAYADYGRGYALGFGGYDLLCIFGSRCSDPDSTTEPNWILQRMVYARMEQRRILDELVDAIFDSSYFPVPGTKQIGEPLTALAVYMFGVAAACFKRQCFSSEHEVRVNIANHRELDIAGTPLQFESRQKDDRRIQYLQVDVRHPQTLRMPLKEILIGPELDADIGQLVVDSVIEQTDSVDRRTVQTRKVSPGELE